MAYSYLHLINKSKLKSFSLFNNEQVLSFDKKIGISIFIPTLINFYNIRGSKKNKDFDLSIKKFLNHKIPSKVGLFNQDKESYLLNLGPDELLYINTKKKLTSLMNFYQNLSKSKSVVTDVSDHYQILYLNGEKVRWILSKGCPVNLDKNVFKYGACAQTILGHSNVTILCEDKNSFLLIFVSSFLNYIINWLKVSSQEHGYKITI